MSFGSIRKISLSYTQPLKMTVVSHINIKDEQESTRTSILFEDSSFGSQTITVKSILVKIIFKNLFIEEKIFRAI